MENKEVWFIIWLLFLCVIFGASIALIVKSVILFC